MLGRRSSSFGAVIQALTIALHHAADRKEVKTHQTARRSSLEKENNIVPPKKALAEASAP
jgi:hypothetical protein